MDSTEAKLIMQGAQEALTRRFPDLTISVKSGSYSPSEFTMKVEFAETVDGNVMTKERVDLIHNLHWYGLSKDDLEKEFHVVDIGTVTLFGLKTRARKYPILIKRVTDEKVYKISSELLLKSLGEKS